jgi:hypothetical protein
MCLDDNLLPSPYRLLAAGCMTEIIPYHRNQDMPCALARQRSSLSLFRRGPLVCAKHVKSTWRRWISPLPPPPPAPREKLAPPCLARPSTSVARPPSPAQRVTAGQTIITHAPPIHARATPPFSKAGRTDSEIRQKRRAPILAPVSMPHGYQGPAPERFANTEPFLATHP